MSIPYSKTEDAVAISGQANCITLPAPTRGVIARLIVKQVGGDAEGFVYDLYDREDACSAVSEQSFNPHDEALGDRELHRIAARHTVAAGSVLDQHFEKIWPYENKSERDVVSRRRLQAIYMELTPNGAGTKDFQISYTILQPDLP